MTNNVTQQLSHDEWLKARSEVVTSTDISAILGCHPRKTKLGLWIEKKEKTIESIEQNDAMEQGGFFEETIANYIAHKNGLVIAKLDFISFPENHIGSSFDFKIIGVRPDSPYREMFEKHGTGILEVKKVRPSIFKDKWDENNAPMNYEAQVQYQMMVSGFKWCIIGVMVGLEKHACYLREYKEWMGEKFKKEVKDFYQSIEDGIMPQIDYAKDGETLKKLFPESTGEAVSIDDDENYVNPLMKQYKDIVEGIEILEQQKEEITNRIKAFAGDASAVIGSFFKVSLTKSKDTPEKTMTIKPEDVGTTIVLSKGRKGGRPFRATFKGE
ncbi:exonuclease [Caudoviricetes sp.]|nr:exonuclease [Caudoviricetes sp.]